jgi:hypothetical protein
MNPTKLFFFIRTSLSFFFLYQPGNRLSSKSVFGSVIAGAFQIAFRAEMHANDVFLFFKNHF